MLCTPLPVSSFATHSLPSWAESSMTHVLIRNKENHPSFGSLAIIRKWHNYLETVDISPARLETKAPTLSAVSALRTMVQHPLLVLSSLPRIQDSNLNGVMSSWHVHVLDRTLCAASSACRNHKTSFPLLRLSPDVFWTLILAKSPCTR